MRGGWMWRSDGSGDGVPASGWPLAASRGPAAAVWLGRAHLPAQCGPHRTTGMKSSPESREKPCVCLSSYFCPYLRVCFRVHCLRCS